MKDTQQSQGNQVEQQCAPAAASSQELVLQDTNEGKSLAILSYALNFVGIPFFLVPLIMRDNEFALFHAKQCFILWLGGIAAGILSVLLFCIVWIFLPLAGIFLLVLNIIGLVNAAKGEAKPVPLIGKWGVDWFKGIRKV